MEIFNCVLAFIWFSLCSVQSADLSYSLEPLEGVGFGAEITGLNIKEVKVGEHDDLIKQIQDDLSEKSALYLGNQGALTNEELRNITSWWGLLRCNGGPRDAKDKCVIDNTNGPATPTTSDRARIWHMDGSYEEFMDRAIVYHVPDKAPEGPTLILPLAGCVERLTREEREKYQGLWYVMSGGIKRALLVLHPVTQAVVFRPYFLRLKSFIWNYGTEQEVVVTDRLEVRNIQRELHEIIDVRCMDLALARNWKQGDVVIIDNFAVVHRAGDQVPRDPVRPNPLIIKRVSAYSTVIMQPAKDPDMNRVNDSEMDTDKAGTETDRKDDTTKDEL